MTVLCSDRGGLIGPFVRLPRDVASGTNRRHTRVVELFRSAMLYLRAWRENADSMSQVAFTTLCFAMMAARISLSTNKTATISNVSGDLRRRIGVRPEVYIGGI